MLHRALLTLLICLSAHAQTPPDDPPVIGPRGVQHGATFQILTAPPFSGPPQGVAPGAIFLLQGERLGPDELVAGQAPFGLRLPDVPGGTEVHVRSIGSGKVAQASIVYAVDYQVAAILPRDFPLGDAQVTVWSGGRASERVTVPVVFSFPGLFTVSQDGTGRGVVQNVADDGSLEVNGLTRSARPGQYVTLWGTGLGLVEREEVQVIFGEEVYPVAYAGPAPGLPGVDQINVRIPDDLPDRGCYVRLVVAGGGLGSGPASIALADENGPCDHPWGLSGERMAEIEAGDRASVISISLNTSASDPSPAPGPGQQVLFQASGQAYTLDVNGVERNAKSMPFEPEPGCVHRTSISTSGGPPIMPPPPHDIPSDRTPAGYPWVLTGPSGQTVTLESFAQPNATGLVRSEGIEGGAFSPGEWRVTIPGGAEIGALDFTLSMPEPLAVTAPPTLKRGEDLELSWPSDGLLASDRITATLVFRMPVPGEPDSTRAESTVCTAGPGDSGIVVEWPASAELDGAVEADLAIGLRRVAGPPHPDTVDRIEATTRSSQSWSIPLE